MINYSIALRAVNTNLLEINQAKSRIAKAKEAGLAPDPADVELAATELQTKAYAVAQYSDVMTIEKFAKHITSHGCVYSRADISAILYMAVDCIREMLLDGKKIQLGDLGSFSVALSSKGAKDAKSFTSGNINGVTVVWECGQEFKTLLADAEFQLVAPRKAQQAVVSAIKDGETLVDLNKPAEEKGDTEGGGTGNTDPNGGGSGNGGSDNQQGGTTTEQPNGNGDNTQLPGGGTSTEDDTQHYV